MIRVMHALNELHPSGAERMLASAAPLWAEHGIECTVLGAGARHPFAEQLRDLGYQVLLIPATRSVRGLSAFAMAVRAVEPDVVHLHAESMFAPMTVAARSNRSVRAVFRTVHSVVDPSGSRHRRRRRLVIARLAGMQPFACGAEVAAHERRYFGLDATVIENWVDTAAFAAPMSGTDLERLRAGLGGDHGDVVITLVGNCARAKNHELLLEAAAATPGRVKIVHVGQTDLMSPHEQGLVAELQARGSMVMLGRREDVAGIVRASDFIAIPSRNEGLSIVAAEALCAGTPVLAARSSGLVWLEDFASPTTIASELSAWVSALASVAAGGGPTRQAIADDRSAAIARFSAGRGVAAWAEVYRRAITSRSSGQLSA